MSVQFLLLKRAGLSEADVAAGRTDNLFNDIADILKDIHKGKEVLYGDYLITHGSDSDKLFLLQHFCDLKRKYVRYENYSKRVLENKDVDIYELLDTLSDLAVYSIMGLQMVDELLKREQERKDYFMNKSMEENSCDNL